MAADFVVALVIVEKQKLNCYLTKRKQQNHGPTFKRFAVCASVKNI